MKVLAAVVVRLIPLYFFGSVIRCLISGSVLLRIGNLVRDFVFFKYFVAKCEQFVVERFTHQVCFNPDASLLALAARCSILARKRSSQFYGQFFKYSGS